MSWLLILSVVSGLLAIAASAYARWALEPPWAQGDRPGLRRALTYLAVGAALLSGLALFGWLGAEVVDTILHGDEDSPGIGY